MLWRRCERFTQCCPVSLLPLVLSPPPLLLLQVVAVGPGAMTRDGKVLPMNVKVSHRSSESMLMQASLLGVLPPTTTASLSKPAAHSTSASSPALTLFPSVPLPLCPVVCRWATRCCCLSTAATPSRWAMRSCTCTARRTFWASSTLSSSKLLRMGGQACTHGCGAMANVWYRVGRIRIRQPLPVVAR